MINLYTYLEIQSRNTLSPYGRTFSKEIVAEFVEHATNPNITYMYFNSDEITTAEEANAINNVIPDLAGQFSDSTSLTNGFTGVVNLSTLGAALPGLTLESVGDTVVYNTKNYPSYFTVEYVSGAFTYLIHVWMQSSAFIANTPGAEFTVVPLIGTIDPLVDNTLYLQTNFSTAEIELGSRTIDQYMDRAQLFLQGTVVTGFESVTLIAHDPENPVSVLQVTFMVGYNGQLGVTYKNLIGAITDYLLSLSDTYTLEDWYTVLPELNAVGTYYIVPSWGRVALNNTIPDAYRPTTTFYDSDGNSTIHKVWDLYYSGLFTEDDFNKKVDFLVSNYKSLGFYVMSAASATGGGWERFSETFNDYMLLSAPSYSQPVGLSEITFKVIVDTITLLGYAETYSVNDAHPTGTTVENFGGKNYITLIDTSNSAKLYVLLREDDVLGDV